MEAVRLSSLDARYPPAVKATLGSDVPACITALGSLSILSAKTLALFCSLKCPGSLILRTYDLAQSLREQGTAVASGFHSPMERECLSILLRGTQPMIFYPARSIVSRVHPEYREPLAQGRLLILSPFDEKERRVTRETSFARNRFVAALADTILVAYAEPNGTMQHLCGELLTWGKPLFTLADEANAHLIALGAKPVSPDNAVRLV